MGGVLYHANYFHLYEELREAFFYSVNYPYSRLVDEHRHLAIVETHQRFIRPIHYGQTVHATLMSSAIKKSSFILNYSFSLNKKTIHTAQTRHALVRIDPKGITSERLPIAFQEHLLSIAK